MYVARTLESSVTSAAQQFPVVLLTGARQVGKTTLLMHLRQGERTYVTLDDPLVLSLAKADPALFMQRFPPPVLIDEIQYATELLPYIKMVADRAGRPGRPAVGAAEGRRRAVPDRCGAGAGFGQGHPHGKLPRHN